MKTKKLSGLVPDGRNMNKGTEYGGQLLTQSLQRLGAGRSILVDKNNNIIAGNKTAETAQAIGMEDIIEVESDGTKLVVVKRTDLDINSKEGRELALADNQVGKVNLDFDADVVDGVTAEFDIDLTDWGMGQAKGKGAGKEKEIDKSLPTEHKCPSCGYEY